MAEQNILYSNVNAGARPQSLGSLIGTFKRNFLTRDVEIAPGLTYRQYDVVKRIYYYIHNRFESGDTDEKGDAKHFYDLHTYRNSQVTKNIKLQTKDSYVKAETPNSVYKSYLLRREFMGWAKECGYGLKLAQLAEDLPQFGTVVWKKIKCQEDDGTQYTDVVDVDLMNLINDPVVSQLKDGLVVERHLLTQDELTEKTVWDQDDVAAIIRSGRTVTNTPFMSVGVENTQGFNRNHVDDTTPYYEIYEMWGEIPLSMYRKYKETEVDEGDDLGNTNTDESDTEMTAGEAGEGETPEMAGVSGNETIYVMGIVSGIENGDIEHILYLNEAERDEFPYEEVHLRRMRGRWLGFGNVEALFGLTERANELTNRFYGSLRIGALHLYQTRDRTFVKNVLTDLEDGDVVDTKSEIAPIATEIRAFTQYQSELVAIERQADRVCNSFEVVTGETLPSGTPFRLGAQQLANANKFFEFVRDKCGLFLENIFNNWLLPEFATTLTDEHVLELVDDTDDIDMYLDARKKIFQYEALKQYILQHNMMPSSDQLGLVGELAKGSILKGPKQIKVLKDYYADQKYSIKFISTGENEAVGRNMETLSTTFQALVANPAALQDPRLLKIFNMILEEAGFSPLQLSVMNQKPTNPSLNPANQGGNGVAAAQAAEQGAGGGPQVQPETAAAVGGTA